MGGSSSTSPKLAKRKSLKRSSFRRKVDKDETEEEAGPSGRPKRRPTTAAEGKKNKSYKSTSSSSEFDFENTVEYGYLHHFGPSKFDEKKCLMQISLEPFRFS